MSLKTLFLVELKNLLEEIDDEKLEAEIEKTEAERNCY